jgi:transcriptional regulator with XRE-family HTH domain
VKLGNWLHSQGLTQDAFAEIVGSNKSSVSRWVDGRVVPRREHLLRIAETTAGAVTANDFMDAAAHEPGCAKSILDGGAR